jgi:serine/threonine-protein kinase
MPEASSDVRVVGRYALCDRIAGGGMATVHLGRLLGEAGFSRTVAIKRLHAHLAEDPEFVSMFIDEARVAARIHHPNVVSTLDVVARDNELFLVMEYVHGESLARLMRGAAERRQRIPPRIACAIAVGFLHGLHAAHDARNERGEPLELVHRDVSPQNVLVGIDGVPRVVDFGVAKAVGRVQTTRDGQLKGKLAYMAPEQMSGGAVTRRTDIYAASIVLWEMLAGRRLFQGENEAAVVKLVLSAPTPPPSSLAPVPATIDRIVLRGLSREPEERFQTAREMALAIEQAIDVALPSEVGAWVQSIAEQALVARATLVGNVESSARIEPPLAVIAGLRPPFRPPRRSAPDGIPAPTDPPTMLTASSEGEPPSRAARRPLIVAIAVGIAGVAAVLLFARLGSTPSHGTGAASAAMPPPQPAASAAQASSSPAPDSPPHAVPASVDSAPSAASSASPEPVVTRPAAVQRPARAAPPAAPPAAKRAPAAACDPPYRIDASGRRIFKVECL